MSREINFLKKHRISHRSDFLELFSKGKRKSCNNIRICFLPDENVRWAFSISKKVGNAVYRNKIRRILRETLRLNFENFGLPVKCLIQVFPFKEDSGDLRGNFQEVLEKAGLLK